MWGAPLPLLLNEKAGGRANEDGHLLGHANHSVNGFMDRLRQNGRCLLKRGHLGPPPAIRRVLSHSTADSPPGEIVDFDQAVARECRAAAVQPPCLASWLATAAMQESGCNKLKFGMQT